MEYISTRGASAPLSFDDVLLAGLARDGGLYVPGIWPKLTTGDLQSLSDATYGEVAARVIEPFMSGSVVLSDLQAICTDTYAAFTHPDVAPLVDLGDDTHLMELFHGPTLAFKDYALQLVGHLFDYVLTRRGERLTIVGATSGDTGPAGIEACRDRESLDIFMLHPKGRTSEVQRRQMTTVDAANVFNIAVEGTFDDCQDLVKELFADQSFRDEINLSAVNSINWARVMGQAVYYVWAALQISKQSGRAENQKLAFAVPTGNFGNVFAGYGAVQMGLPVEQLIVGSNRNDILARFFETAEMEIRGVEPSLSPSMDIQVSSNFERLLFDLYDRDGAAVAKAVSDFRETGRMVMAPDRFQRATSLFAAARFNDEQTIQTIREVYEATGRLIDPHSAVGLAAGRAMRRNSDTPLIALATAHPAKFPDAVEKATGIRPDLPEHLADLQSRPEKSVTLPNAVGPLRDYVRGHARAAN